MKIILAFDSFKGSLDALEACKVARRGILSVFPDTEVLCKPMADGGEGTAAILMSSESGEWIPCPVTGPLFDMQVNAGFVWFPEVQEALVEMAVASGLPLLDKEQYNPLETTTYGTGELIKAAAAKGAKKIRLAVGGSATVDGGTGAAEALGYRFLDKDGNALRGKGGNLSRVFSIVRPEVFNVPELEVLCDVVNPLTGPDGAAAVYGPQKGATREMVEELDAGLENLSKRVLQFLGISIEHLPGAGAAGGLSAGAVAFMGGKLVPGVEAVMSAHRLEEALEDADWVFTGEGRLDGQSFQGKVVDGVCCLAKKTNTRVAVIAGAVELDSSECKRLGTDYVAALKSVDLSAEESVSRAAELLEKRVVEWARGI